MNGKCSNDSSLPAKVSRTRYVRFEFCKQWKSWGWAMLWHHYYEVSCLSFRPSVRLSIHRSILIFLTVCVSIRPLIHMSVCPFICLSVPQSKCLAIHCSICLPVHPFICLCMYVDVCPPIYMSVRPSTYSCPYIYPSIVSRVCMFFRLSVCLYIRLSVCSFVICLSVCDLKWYIIATLFQF
jgi:hypothetical protein